jgi:hypothetical protein
MYYRIAIQGEAQPPWKWQSTVLSGLCSLLQWLQVNRTFPQERLRICSCASLQGLNEQLARENQGLVSASVLAPQFLQERRIAAQGAAREAVAGGTQACKQTAPISVEPSPFPDKCGMSELYRRREELERGAGGDHDLPDQFTLPTSLPQVLGWIQLLVRVQRGDFQLEPLPGGVAITIQAHEEILPLSPDATWREPGTLRVHSEEIEQKGGKIA